MIVLYRQAKSAPGAALELALKDMVAAYEVVEATPDALPAGITQLPAIVDGDRDLRRSRARLSGGTGARVGRMAQIPGRRLLL